MLFRSLDLDRMAELSGVTDFFGIGGEIWNADDPAEALAALSRAMG